MICHRCLLRAAGRHAPIKFTSRALSADAVRHAQPVTAQTTTATNPRPNDLPAATSTSAAQPFSEPLTYSPDRIADLPIQRGSSKPPVKVASSVPGGTPLKGLNFMKNKQDPIALEDEEYPAWLWGVLEKKTDGAAGQGKGGEEGDLFSKSKKQRRLAAKALRKQQMLHPELLQPKIPLYQQSVDLPAGDGTIQGAVAASTSRHELTRAMREKRRAKIKEDNFLKAM